MREGKLKGGERLGSSRVLARELSIARNTVVIALDQLVAEGVLEVRPRSGYYVSTVAPAPLSPIVKLPVTLSSGREPDWQTILTKRPSRLRNIEKASDWQRYAHPFVYGQFDPELFPTNDWRECARTAMSVTEIRGWASDQIDGDDRDLIELLRTHVLPRRGIWAGPNEIVLTLGTQQAIFLVASLLYRPGGKVGVEDPGYPDARNIFETAGADVVRLPVDGEGMTLPAAARRCEMLFVTPGSQCPTTVVMSPRRRDKLIAIARETSALIIEDDYGVELLERNTSTPALKSADRDGRVIYVGSLSKILAPGLRLGYVVAPEPLIRELRSLRRLMLRHPPTNNQRMVALFLALGHADSYVRRHAEALRQRAVVLKDAIERFMPFCEATVANNESSAWIVLPKRVDGRRLAKLAAERSILIEPGDVFFANPSHPCNAIRLGFGSISSERIRTGIERLARLIKSLD